jgi:hypothetical protein
MATEKEKNRQTMLHKTLHKKTKSKQFLSHLVPSIALNNEGMGLVLLQMEHIRGLFVKRIF